MSKKYGRSRAGGVARARRSHPFRNAILAVAATTCVAGASPVWAQDALRFDGEYGLYVRVVEEGLEVRWITTEMGAGVARAFVHGEKIQTVETPPGQAHQALIESTAGEVVLEYGSAGAELHRTRVFREPEAESRIEIEGVESVYIFGDVHGEYDRVVRLLRKAELIDEDAGWSGGDTHLVFLGDIFDRGNDVTRVLWFLYRLEREAAEAGGSVHVVLGNHEAMVMSGDLEYVGGKETILAQAHGVAYGEMFDPRESILGRWLARKPALVRMGDLLLAHGGVSPDYLDYTIEQYQDTLRTFIDEELFVHWNDQEYLDSYAERLAELAESGEEVAAIDSAGIVRRYEFFFASESVLWYRDLVLSDTLGAHLDAVLEHFDTKVHVIGHTPVETIQERYEGKLIATDLEDAATEMLHLSRREDGGWDRFRIPLEGPPTRLSCAASRCLHPETHPSAAVSSPAQTVPPTTVATDGSGR
ncbi:MAG: metallophosphoesterase [Gemmatimonadota bacterium]